MMRWKAQASFEASVPFAAMAELLEGVWRASDPRHEKARIDAVLSSAPIVYPDEQTLVLYARASAYLRKSGQPIPTNDIWIAALAIQRGVPLLSDDAHFVRVPGLKIIPVR